MNPEAISRFISDLQPAYADTDPLAGDRDLEQRNVAGLSTLYQALLAGDGGAVAALMAADVELEITGPAGMPLTGRWKGRDEVLQATAVNFGKLEDQKPEILSLIAQGNQIAVVARERGRVRATGEPYDVRWLQLYTFDEGRITRMLEFCDDPGLLSAA